MPDFLLLRVSSDKVKRFFVIITRNEEGKRERRQEIIASRRICHTTRNTRVKFKETSHEPRSGVKLAQAGMNFVSVENSPVRFSFP